jgi:hypothetical protein
MFFGKRLITIKKKLHTNHLQNGESLSRCAEVALDGFLKVTTLIL